MLEACVLGEAIQGVQGMFSSSGFPVVQAGKQAVENPEQGVPAGDEERKGSGSLHLIAMVNIAQFITRLSWVLGQSLQPEESGSTAFSWFLNWMLLEVNVILFLSFLLSLKKGLSSKGRGNFNQGENFKQLMQ